MKRKTLNLLATAVITAGGAHLSGAALSAATSTVGGGSSTAPTVWCSGGTPADPCICTSGDGKAVCRGATCTADETSCTYTGFPKDVKVGVIGVGDHQDLQAGNDELGGG